MEKIAPNNKKSLSEMKGFFFRRDGQIRTDDLHIPNVARYRATLHPEVLQKHYYKCCYKMRVQRYNFFDSKKENPIFFK